MKILRKEFFNKIIDINISKYDSTNMNNDNFKLLSMLIENKTENINGLLYSFCISDDSENIFKLMSLPLTKEQRIFCLYQYMLNNNSFNLMKLGENNKLEIDEILTVIHLLFNHSTYLKKSIILWSYLLIYTNFKANKKFFNYLMDVYFEYLTPQVVQQFVNVQLQKKNKDIYYFCKEYYKENPSAFLYFPVDIKEVKDFIYTDLEENISLYHLGIICDINIDNEFRLKLLNIYESLIEGDTPVSLNVNLRNCFMNLKKYDKSEISEITFINIWGKFLLTNKNNWDITFPEEKDIEYESNLNKLESFKLMIDLNES